MVLGRLWTFLLLASTLALASPPVVRKVEPPNWWIGLRDPMLLIAGENLSNATVRVTYPGVRVLRSEPAANGRYLFVWLKILPTARPGRVALSIRTPESSTSAELPLARRRPHTTPDAFQGLSTDDVIYLIMPDRFADGDPANNQPPQSPGTYDRSRPRAYHGGDLRGIRDRLPYLRDLGVTALWLNPVYDNDNRSANDYHGYGAVDYYAVDEHLGTLAEFEELVKAAHQQGIKTFLDNVPNHCGPRHPWTAAPPQPDWFHGTVEQHMAARSPFDPLTDPHSVPRQWRDMVEGWFANVLPDLNQENPRVAEYLLLNSLWWVEQSGLDGFRLDTFPYVSRKFWSDWHRDLFQAYPRISTFGEVFHGDVTVTSYFAGGQRRADGIDSGVTTLFDFPLYYALRNVVIRGAPATGLAQVLQRDWLYPRPELLVTFLGNHDVLRFSSEPGSSPEKLRLAFSLLFTLRGVPQLYAGDEIGMPGEDDPDNRRDFPGGFPGDPRNAFAPEGRTPEEQAAFSHVQTLLQLRREHAALRSGRLRHLFADETAYVFLRQTEGETLLVVFNNSEMPRRLTVELGDTPIQNAQALAPLFSARSAVIESGRAQIEIAARTVAIYEVR
ncbi:MAG: alpha-amylase family glycosyl hydrolase [Terriglobales bacterium]